MTLFKRRARQAPKRRINPRLGDSLPAASNRAKRPALAALVVVAMTMFGWPSSQLFAADATDVARSVPGATVPGTGRTETPTVSPQRQASLPSTSSGASLSGPGPADGRCAALRKQYAKSQACFARYRMKNRGLRPGAFQRCKQLKDPSWACGPATVP